MKKNRWFLRLLVLLVICGALNVTLSAAAEAGSADDPLVTLSYLNETFMDDIMDRVDEKIAQRDAQSGTASGFAVVLADGAVVGVGVAFATCCNLFISSCRVAPLFWLAACACCVALGVGCDAVSCPVPRVKYAVTPIRAKHTSITR